jgi:hypothetical protein
VSSVEALSTTMTSHSTPGTGSIAARCATVVGSRGALLWQQTMKLMFIHTPQKPQPPKACTPECAGPLRIVSLAMTRPGVLILVKGWSPWREVIVQGRNKM